MVGETTFLQGGFLMRRWGTVWDVPEPSSSLVLYREKLGENEPWHLARLARDGKVLWKQSTGLPDFDQIADGGSRVIFCGRLPADPGSSRRPEEIVWVDERDGSTSRITIQDEPTE